jgi:adenylate cyclase class IV
MQVEAKLTIADPTSFNALVGGLTQALGQPIKVVRQRNLFLDGANGELAAINAVCRVRTSCIGDQAPSSGQSSVVLKEHNEVEDGTSARFVVEADLPPGAAFESDLALIEKRVAETCVGDSIRGRFGDAISLRGVGTFDNTRSVFSWEIRPDVEPLKLNADRTTYPFGEGYEIEVPCSDAVMIDEVLEGLRRLISSAGIADDAVALGGSSKFQQYAAGMANMNAASSSHMRVEAKLLLPGINAYERVLARLIASHIRTDTQRNIFFDTAQGELSRAGAYLRLRATDNARYTITIKEHSDVVEGSGLSWVQEEDVPSDVAEALMNNSDLRPLMQLRSSTVASALAQRFNISSNASVKFIGGFDNRRSVFRWPQAASIQLGLELRVDETTYAGSGDATRYEVEVADIAVPVHDVIELLQASLAELGIETAQCDTTKFQEMLRRAE